MAPVASGRVADRENFLAELRRDPELRRNLSAENENTNRESGSDLRNALPASVADIIQALGGNPRSSDYGARGRIDVDPPFSSAGLAYGESMEALEFLHYYRV